MLGNCEKNMAMVIPSTTTNEWPHENPIDEKSLMASANKAMEKITTQDQQQQQQPLKCPRCDSSNTKFCYYNNYSLSQPRHFCKACKRYWTRGGTLRNVPVGGGCRKNKRVKRPASAGAGEASTSSSSAPTTNPNHVQQPHIDLMSSSPGTHINPLFYSLLSTNPNSELNNFPYPRFNSRVSNVDTVGYDHHHLQRQPSIGLGFSSGLLDGNGFHSNLKQNIQDIVSSSNSLLSSYNPIFGSAINSSTSTMASLIASSLQQQKLTNSTDAFKDDDHQHADHFQGFGGSYDEAHQMSMKDHVKMEEGLKGLDWNHVPSNQNHNIDQIHSSDPSGLLWGPATAAGAWLDPSSLGSSVPSLI